MKEPLALTALCLAALSVQGDERRVGTGDGVAVDAAQVTAEDIVADTGVIHVIDTVVAPK